VYERDARAGALILNSAGELHDCVLGGDLPCVAIIDGQQRNVAIRFALDLRRDPARSADRPKNLRLSMAIDGAMFEVADEWFEDGLFRLQDTLLPQVRLMCCVTCLYWDYSPGGHGLMGMRCHRDAKEQYLAVRSKADYWNVPVTEEVPRNLFVSRVPTSDRRHRLPRLIPIGAVDHVVDISARSDG
jgi:hypothetical protein